MVCTYLMKMGDNVILVTGFGPFDKHKVNASWEAVKLLPDNVNGFNIVKEEVPVVYSYIAVNVPKLWNTHNPILVIHVGVSSYTNKLTLEKCAFRGGYERLDVSGTTHPTGIVCCIGEECITTDIDVDEICASLNESKAVEACSSVCAGRYLCEFIYYVSLHIDKNRTLFVHVPPLNEPYSVQQLAEGLQEIIKCALRQINEKIPKVALGNDAFSVCVVVHSEGVLKYCHKYDSFAKVLLHLTILLV